MTEREPTAAHAEAVSDLFAERYGQLVRHARKHLRAFGVPPSWADPEDVVQTALTNVLACSEPIEKLPPYVFSVIRNEVRRATQRYHGGRGYGSWEVDVQLEFAGPAADPCGAADLRLTLESALRHLPQQQRKAVFCTKTLGLTQAETAMAMKTAPGTVATHVSRALVALRVALVCALGVAFIVFELAWLRSGTMPVNPAAGAEAVRRLLHSPTSLGWSIIGGLLVWALWMPVGSESLRQLRNGQTADRLVRSRASDPPPNYEAGRHD